jgi:glycosyltransferase involved in cell wall biosynthesis
MRKKIAFLKTGSFSLVNENLIEIFEQMFSEYDLNVIDVGDVLVKRRRLDILLAMLWDYKHEAWKYRREFFTTISSRATWSRTPYYFYQVRKAIRSHLSNWDEYVFTFQTQSLFDSNLVYIPHFIYTDHTHLANLRYPMSESTRLFSEKWIELEKSIYTSATKIFSTSKFTATSLIEDYGVVPHKINVVYSGMNVAVNVDLSTKSYDGKHILFIGREWERKGGPDLLEAFRKVREQHPTTVLTVVGTSPEINEPGVNVVGPVPARDIPKYLLAATVFCMPSLREPSAVALVEAAASGLPVITTDIGGTPDRVIHNETGYLVTPGDVDGIARSLHYLFRHPEMAQQMGAQGRRLAMNRFVWGKVGERIAAEIHRVLDDL